MNENVAIFFDRDGTINEDTGYLTDVSEIKISDENFKEVLANCLKIDGVHIIDLAVDYSLNHSILNVLLKEKTCIL